MENVFIVDDYDINLFILEEYLKDSYKTYCFNNAKDCIKALEDSNIKVKVILMDCKMPCMDGYEATSIIKRIYKDIKIIGVTGNSYGESLKKCYDSGMNDVIVKPIVYKKLIESIENL